jgi:FAD/FMN-containing dehydrogenases
MYEARKGLYSSSLGMRDSKGEYIVIGDVVVPPSELPTALRKAEEALKELNLKCLLFGHIGDGNIHANIFADLKSSDHMSRVDQFQMRLAHIALDCKGSVSAEHGIGLEKKALLLEELKARDSVELIDLMKGVKKAFDERMILNRGKIFD